MWISGIIYVLLSGVPYLAKRWLRVQYNKPSIFIHRMFGVCGVTILLFSWIALYVEEPWKNILPLIPLLFFAIGLLFQFRVISRQMKALEAGDKDGEKDGP